MIVRNIYFGTTPVYRVYHNKRIVWERLMTLAVDSAPVEIFTDIVVNGNAITAILFNGSNEIQSYVSLDAKALKALLLSATAQEENYVSVLLRRLSAILGEATAEIKTTVQNIGYPFSAILGNSKAESKTEIENTFVALPAVVMLGKTAEYDEADVNGYAAKAIHFGTYKMPIVSDITAMAVSYRICEALGAIAESVTNTEGVAYVCLAIDIKGTITAITDADCAGVIVAPIGISGSGNTNSEGVAEIARIVATLLQGKAETENNATGNGIGCPAKVLEGQNESNTNTVGGLGLWYLPILKDGVLEIRQAYSASLTDGVLEVI